MRILPLIAAALVAFAAHAATPTVSDVVVSQLPNRLVKVTYTLSDARAIVTPTFKLDGVEIDSQKVVTLGGDVRRIVAPGKRCFVWDVRKDWTDADVTEEKLSVDLKVWSLSAPPPKLVVDLHPMKGGSVSNVLFYVSEADLPGGVADARYRSEKLLMTLVPAKEVRWRMGDGTEAGSKYVTLSKDFYISAFTFTQGQGTLALGKNGGYNTNHTDSACCPMEVGYGDLRGKEAIFGAQPVTNTCYVKSLQTQTGLPLDVPSEFQWEFAMRGGSSSSYLGADYGWWGKTYEWGPCKNCTRNGAHPVGLKKANAFGVYDVVGNVREYTRTGSDVADLKTPALDTTEERDPEGPYTRSNNVVIRSCRHEDGWDYAKVRYLYTRRGFWAWSTNNNIGFRLILPVDWE